VIDTLPFPHLNEYDLNLWIDDDGFLRASAYQLCLERAVKLDEDGEPTYQPTNYYCGDAITLVCIHQHEYLEPDRDDLYAHLEDEWDTISSFLSDPREWKSDFPNFYELVCEVIKDELLDEFGNPKPYEACQHA
jgi:hypothetical protein